MESLKVLICILCAIACAYCASVSADPPIFKFFHMAGDNLGDHNYRADAIIGSIKSDPKFLKNIAKGLADIKISTDYMVIGVMRALGAAKIDFDDREAVFRNLHALVGPSGAAPSLETILATIKPNIKTPSLDVITKDVVDKFLLAKSHFYHITEVQDDNVIEPIVNELRQRTDLAYKGYMPYKDANGHYHRCAVITCLDVASITSVAVGSGRNIISVVRHPNYEEYIIVVTVHLKTPHNKRGDYLYLGTQTSELEAIKAAVDKLKLTYPGSPVVIMGDFNAFDREIMVGDELDNEESDPAIFSTMDHLYALFASTSALGNAFRNSKAKTSACGAIDHGLYTVDSCEFRSYSYIGMKSSISDHSYGISFDLQFGFTPVSSRLILQRNVRTCVVKHTEAVSGLCLAPIVLKKARTKKVKKPVTVTSTEDPVTFNPFSSLDLEVSCVTPLESGGSTKSRITEESTTQKTKMPKLATSKSCETVHSDKPGKAKHRRGSVSGGSGRIIVPRHSIVDTGDNIIYGFLTVGLVVSVVGASILYQQKISAYMKPAN